MNNHGIPSRPLFCLENSRHCRLIQRIRSQPIHGLSRQRHQAPAAQNRSRPLQRLRRMGSLKMIGIDNQSQCLHAPIVASLAQPPLTGPRFVL